MSASSMHDPSPQEPRPAEPWPSSASGAGEPGGEAADLLRSFRDSLRNPGASAQHGGDPRREDDAPAAGSWTGTAGAGAWTGPTTGPATGGPEPGTLGTGAGTLAELVDLALRLLEALRTLMPPELRHHWEAIQREVLLAVRALIDNYLERLEGGPGPSPVEDIPIE